MFFRNRLLLYLIYCGLLCGCNSASQPEIPVEPVKVDTLASFQELVPTEPKLTVKGTYGYSVATFTDFSFDVQQTNSLVSPYTAEIVFNFRLDSTDDNIVKAGVALIEKGKMRVLYAHQNDHWKKKDVEKFDSEAGIWRPIQWWYRWKSNPKAKQMVLDCFDDQ